MSENSPVILEMVDPLTYSELLNSAAAEVTSTELESKFIQDVINAMFDLAAGKGKSSEDTRQVVGLAAPQVGISKRIILIDLTANGANQKQNLEAIINPCITYKSKDVLPGREGCWSCGNICGNVERSKRVILEGMNRDGEKVKLELIDFVARIAQHETDHLDGIRFPDRIPASEPEKLHWVNPSEFEDYRSNWQHWSNLCPRERWIKLKHGVAEII